MDKGKIKEKFAELFNVNPQLTNASFDIFIRKIAEELSSGEAFSVPGLGIFQKKNDNVLHFIDPLQEENDKLFVKIEVPQAAQNQFDLEEDEFDVGVESDVIDLTDENQLAQLETLETEINEKIKTFEKLKDFDPYALIASEEVESQETEMEAESSLEFEGENIHEAANELDEDLQKELEEQLFDDLENDLSDELSDELNSEEEHSEEKQEEIFDTVEEPEEKIEEIKEEENENEEETEEEPVEKETREDEIMSEEELQNAFDDLDNEPSEAKEEDNDKKPLEKGKKKSLFSFLKKGKKKEKKDKKEKKSKKEKKKKDKSKGKEQKEKDENGEGGEGKKKISKKLLIILIAVFVLITAGGVYYFFFTGDETHEEQVSEEHGKEHKAEGEHGGEHGKESIEDSLWRNRKRPLTPEEIGETRKPDAEYSVDINNPEKTSEKTYLLPPEADLEDPLLTKEFPHEKRITNTIYENEGKYMVQVSSWKRSSRARKIVQKLRRAGYNAFIVKAYLPALGGTWYRVRIGFFNTLKEAEEFLKKKEYLNVR